MTTIIATIVAVWCSLSTSTTGVTGTPMAADDPRMTNAERAELIELLLAAQQEFLIAVDGLTDAQWSFKPAPERWSVAEVAEHIMLADAMLLETARRSLTGPPDPEWLATVSKTGTLKNALPNRSRRVDAPGAIQPQRMLTRAEILTRFKEGRARALAFVRDTDAPLKSYTAKNPFFGALNAHQWLLYIPLHHQRHNQQIAEVKASAGYPR